MKKFDVVNAWQCVQGAGGHTVKGRTGTYQVFISTDETRPHTCTCPHFVHRRLDIQFETCKHIDQALRNVCGWNSVIMGGEPFVYGQVKCCPLCTGAVEPVRVAV